MNEIVPNEMNEGDYDPFASLFPTDPLGPQLQDNANDMAWNRGMQSRFQPFAGRGYRLGAA